MEILNEKLTTIYNDEMMNESPSPMWMTYMDAFTQFIGQSEKRFDRYATYEEMDRYPEIHLALDILSTEMFSFEPVSNTPFIFDTMGKVPENIMSKAMSRFTEILKLKTVLPFAVRQSLKYGDSFYFVVKDKDKKIVGLRRIENKDIDFIEYDEVGINPLNYYISKVKIDDAQLGSYLQFLKFQGLEQATTNDSTSIQSKEGDEYYIIPSPSMLRFMHKGENSQFFPFGESYLESIFPYWKKVSLLEDSLIIYRIVRAPERRVFYIDVGKAPTKIAEKVVTQTKEEIKRRRTAASQENKEMGITSTFNPLSMQEDYFFAQRADGRGSRVETLPGACLSLDIKIPLLDGRELTLQEIIDEWENNKEKVNWVYSCNPITGELAPGKITWAGITRRNAKVMKITLDNGEAITCTPDHKFPIRDIGFVEAKDLKEGQSLIPFRKRYENISKNRNEYEQVFDVSKNEWIFTHRMVASYFKENILTYEIDGKKDTIHHQNFNRFDNTPKNLVWMNNKDHWKFHQDKSFTKEECIKGAIAAKKAFEENVKKDPEKYINFIKKVRDNKQKFWDEMNPEQYAWIKQQMKDGLAKKRKDSNYEEKYIEKQTINAIKGSKARLKKQMYNPEFKANVYEKSGKSLSEKIKNDKEYYYKLKTHLNKVHQPWKNKKTIFDRTMLEMIITIINDSGLIQKNKLLDYLNNDFQFMKYFQQINLIDDNKGIDKRNLDTFANQHMDKLLKRFNYNGWKDFISKIPVYNHKIVKIETLDYGIDVGTITVDGNEELQDHHTFALSSGVFTKNSNLGEIADVNYFYKKLINGMRVPASYFNTENPPTWNDGKVGSALAEEARFGKWLTEIREQYLFSFKTLFIEFLNEYGISLTPDQLVMKWRESINVEENQELEKLIQRQSVFTGFPMEQFAPTFLQKKVLGWSEEEIQENITQLKKWNKISSSIEGM